MRGERAKAFRTAGSGVGLRDGANELKVCASKSALRQAQRVSMVI